MNQVISYDIELLYLVPFLAFSILQLQNAPAENNMIRVIFSIIFLMYRRLATLTERRRWWFVSEHMTTALGRLRREPACLVWPNGAATRPRSHRTWTRPSRRS